MEIYWFRGYLPFWNPLFYKRWNLVNLILLVYYLNELTKIDTISWILLLKYSNPRIQSSSSRRTFCTFEDTNETFIKDKGHWCSSSKDFWFGFQCKTFTELMLRLILKFVRFSGKVSIRNWLLLTLWLLVLSLCTHLRSLLLEIFKI